MHPAKSPALMDPHMHVIQTQMASTKWSACLSLVSICLHKMFSRKTMSHDNVCPFVPNLLRFSPRDGNSDILVQLDNSGVTVARIDAGS